MEMNLLERVRFLLNQDLQIYNEAVNQGVEFSLQFIDWI